MPQGAGRVGSFTSSTPTTPPLTESQQREVKVQLSVAGPLSQRRTVSLLSCTYAYRDIDNQHHCDWYVEREREREREGGRERM